VIPTTALYTAACSKAYHRNASAFAFPASVTMVATATAFQSVMTAGGGGFGGSDRPRGDAGQRGRE
jgi:hypothetical protein